MNYFVSNARIAAAAPSLLVNRGVPRTSDLPILESIAAKFFRQWLINCPSLPQASAVGRVFGMEGGSGCGMALPGLVLARQKSIQLCDWNDNMSQRAIWLDQAPCDKPAHSDFRNAAAVIAGRFQLKSAPNSTDLISIGVVRSF